MLTVKRIREMLLPAGLLNTKMGITSSATCVINFDGATGFLIGEANKGLKAMFTYMNTARIGTGIKVWHI